MATATFLERWSRSVPMPTRLVVASSMSIYGEGEYACAEHGRVAPRPPPGRQLLARQLGDCICPTCGRELHAVGTSESQAADPDLHLRDHEARPRGALPRRRRAYGIPDSRAAVLQCLRARAGALEPVHRRRGDLRVAAAERASADRVRGRAPVARLHPRRRHRARDRARAGVRRCGGARRQSRHRQRRRPSRRSPRRSRTGLGLEIEPELHGSSTAPATSATASRIRRCARELLGFEAKSARGWDGATCSAGSTDQEAVDRVDAATGELAAPRPDALTRARDARARDHRRLDERGSLARAVPATVFEHAGDVELDVVVVDNESTDGTRELVENEVPAARVVDVARTTGSPTRTTAASIDDERATSCSSTPTRRSSTERSAT